MRERDRETAIRFGVFERLKALEKDLLNIEDLVADPSDDGVCFDISGFYDDMRYVIIVPKYDIRANREDYWEARRKLRESVIDLASRYDLHRTEDRIEDYGEHFYFVFKCGSSWQFQAKTERRQ